MELTVVIVRETRDFLVSLAGFLIGSFVVLGSPNTMDRMHALRDSLPSDVG